VPSRAKKDEALAPAVSSCRDKRPVLVSFQSCPSLLEQQSVWDVAPIGWLSVELKGEAEESQPLSFSTFSSTIFLNLCRLSTARPLGPG
jgi:hypothetical protein